MSCCAEIDAHPQPVKAIAFMADGSGIMTGSLDKTIKHWNIQVSPPAAHSIPVDGEVQAISIAGNYLMWANSVLPPYTPSDAVGVVELMDLGNVSAPHAKCLVCI